MLSSKLSEKALKTQLIEEINKLDREKLLACFLGIAFHDQPLLSNF